MPRIRQLSPSEIQQINDTGITGELSPFTVNNGFGNGKSSHVILIMQGPVKGPIELKEPDAGNVVYVQYGADWKMFPPNAPTLKRTIRIEPDTSDNSQSEIMVELATGAHQGFGVWWPKSENLSK